MQTYTALAALIVGSTMNSAMAMEKYLQEFPNGSSFTQELGHPGKDSSKLSAFATAFSAAELKWSPEFCKATFPGADMTNGEAFGDPCCTWTKGGTPDFTVSAFTTKPAKPTVCAAGGGSSSPDAGLSTGSSSSPGGGLSMGSAEKESEKKEESKTEEASEKKEASTDESVSNTSIGNLLEGFNAESTSDSTLQLHSGPSSDTWGAPPASKGCAAKPARKLRH